MLTFRPRQECFEILVSHSSKPDLHRDIALALLVSAIDFLRVPVASRFGWEIIESLSRSNRPEILLCLFSVFPEGLVATMPSGIFKDEVTENGLKELFGQLSVHRDHCRIFAEKAILPLCHSNFVKSLESMIHEDASESDMSSEQIEKMLERKKIQIQDVHALALCSLQIWYRYGLFKECSQILFLKLTEPVSRLKSNAQRTQAVLLTRWSYMLDAILCAEGFHQHDVFVQTNCLDMDFSLIKNLFVVLCSNAKLPEYKADLSTLGIVYDLIQRISFRLTVTVGSPPPLTSVFVDEIIAALSQISSGANHFSAMISLKAQYIIQEFQKNQCVDESRLKNLIEDFAMSVTSDEFSSPDANAIISLINANTDIATAAVRVIVDFLLKESQNHALVNLQLSDLLFRTPSHLCALDTLSFTKFFFFCLDSENFVETSEKSFDFDDNLAELLILCYRNCMRDDSETMDCNRKHLHEVLLKSSGHVLECFSPENARKRWTHIVWKLWECDRKILEGLFAFSSSSCSLLLNSGIDFGLNSVARFLKTLCIERPSFEGASWPYKPSGDIDSEQKVVLPTKLLEDLPRLSITALNTRLSHVHHDSPIHEGLFILGFVQEFKTLFRSDHDDLLTELFLSICTITCKHPLDIDSGKNCDYFQNYFYD